MKPPMMLAVVAGAIFLYVVGLCLYHSVQKIKEDLQSTPKASESPLARQQSHRAQTEALMELHSLRHQAVTGLKQSSTGLETAKTLFNEGNGVPKFKFNRKTTSGGNGVGVTSHEQQQQQQQQEMKPQSSGSGSSSSSSSSIQRSAVRGKASRFGLPLEVAPAKKEEKASSSSSSGSSNLRHTHIAAIAAAASTNKDEDKDGLSDAGLTVWRHNLTNKLKCLQRGTGGVFLYHVRKAAGTSMRDVLEQATSRWHVGFYEVEGITLDDRFLSYRADGMRVGQDSNSDSDSDSSPSLLSVITLRDPVDRALSMYWYEHVGWFDGIQKKTEKCHKLSDWVATWRDSSQWKMDFMRKNPRSVYVEIENYYVKSLLGWTSAQVDGPLTDSHLSKAKNVLDSFDVVLLTEWMADASQIDAVNALFPGRNMVATKHMVKGDDKAKKRLQATLAADEVEMRELLKQLNGLDIQLFEYAKSLTARRLKATPQLVFDATHNSGGSGSGSGKGENTVLQQCGAKIQRLPAALAGQLGIHQPPGHKAPL